MEVKQTFIGGTKYAKGGFGLICGIGFCSAATDIDDPVLIRHFFSCIYLQR
jgi:hypothetical protein